MQRADVDVVAEIVDISELSCSLASFECPKGKNRKTERSGDILICVTGLLLCMRGDRQHGQTANLCQCIAAMGWAMADPAGWVHANPALSTLSLKAYNQGLPCSWSCCAALPLLPIALLESHTGRWEILCLQPVSGTG